MDASGGRGKGEKSFEKGFLTRAVLALGLRLPPCGRFPIPLSCGIVPLPPNPYAGAAAPLPLFPNFLFGWSGANRLFSARQHIHPIVLPISFLLFTPGAKKVIVYQTRTRPLPRSSGTWQGRAFCASRRFSAAPSGQVRHMSLHSGTLSARLNSLKGTRQTEPRLATTVSMQRSQACPKSSHRASRATYNTPSPW